MRGHVAFRLLVVAISWCCVVGDDRTGQGLTSFPHDLTLTDVAHLLTNNQITKVDYIEVMVNLIQLKIDSNLLEEFPDCSNVTGLTELNLMNNHISDIPYSRLDALVNLQILDLRNNLLMSLPDPAGPKNTIQTIYMSNNYLGSFPVLPNLGSSLKNLYLNNNNITSCPTETLQHLVSINLINLNGNKLYESSAWVPDFRPISSTIQSLYLKFNQLSEFDVSTLDGMSSVQYFLNGNAITSVSDNFVYYDQAAMASNKVHLDDNPLRCDCHAKWLKMSQDRATPSVTTTTCGGPAALSGTTFSGLTYGQLTCSGTDGTRELMSSKQLPSHAVPTYDVINAYAVRSVIECVQLCHDQGDCLVYGYVNNGVTFVENCAITSATLPTVVTRASPWDAPDVEWFLFE